MKVQNIQPTAYNSQRVNSETKNETSFTGATDILVRFWEGVDRGGLAASFTIQDMLGTNIPRTWAAKDVGKDLTGKNNWGAVLENGLREFLTGPSMFVVPWGVLYASTKFGAKSNAVPVQTIKDFAEIIKKSNIDTTSKEAFKKSFYESVLECVFSNFDGIKDIENLAQKGIDIDDYIAQILKMESAKKKGLINNIRNVSMPDSKEEILEGIIKKFVTDKKANTTGYPNFLKALITNTSADKAAKYEVKIGDLIDRMIKYSDDLYESLGKQKGSLDDILEGFTKSRMGSRFATNILMGVFTAAAMWFIPKIYTVNKTNPETDPVRQKASELKGDKSNQTNGQVNFSGGGISKLMNDIGEKVNPGQNTWLSKHASSLESNWINVARPIFYTLITCFTLIPRLIQSTKRDIESSKKNGGPVQWDETSNILRRDITTILTILFAMEGMGAGMGLLGSKKSGIVLTSDILRKEDSFFKKFIKIFNPEGGVQVLGKAENTAQMSNFENLDQVIRFFEKNDENKGNLYKLLHIDAKVKNKEGKEASTFYNAAKKLFGDVIENEKLKAVDLRNYVANNKLNENDVKEFLGILNNTKKNPLLNFANKLNAIFQTVSLAIVTGFLGFGLPKINDAIIKKKYLKNDNTLQPKYSDPNMPIPAYSILNNLKPNEKQIYQYFLGNVKE